MSIAICPRCKTSANAGMCFKCNTPMQFDEHFPATWDEEHVYSVRRHRLLMKRAARRKRFGPLEQDNLDRIASFLDRAIEWTGESRDENAKEIRELMKQARGKLFKSNIGRAV